MADDGELDLFRTAMGVGAAYVLGGLVRLGVPDVLDDDGTDPAEVAERLGVRADLLTRLLRASVPLGAVVDHGGRFALTDSGRTLRRDHPSGGHALIRLFTEPSLGPSWAGLDTQVRTGEVPFDAANGMPYFAFLAGDAEASDVFRAAVQAYTLPAARGLAERGGFDRFGTVVDVGGGNGSTLAAVLTAHRALRGVVLETLTGAPAVPPTLAAAGVQDRCTVEAGDFFAAVPAGADAYLLKTVLHDWDDDRCVAILDRCREALPEHGRVLVVETVLPDTVQPDEPVLPYLFDIAMLVNLGGRERSRDEFEALFRRAGLEPAGFVPVFPETGFCMLEAVRARGQGETSEVR